jgi:hypothetical protein
VRAYACGNLTGDTLSETRSCQNKPEVNSCYRSRDIAILVNTRATHPRRRASPPPQAHTSPRRALWWLNAAAAHLAVAEALDDGLEESPRQAERLLPLLPVSRVHDASTCPFEAIASDDGPEEAQKKERASKGQPAPTG